ncbi:MAG: hypothetical protein ACXVHT_01290 [Methanobacterium sp.]
MANLIDPDKEINEAADNYIALLNIIRDNTFHKLALSPSKWEVILVDEITESDYNGKKITNYHYIEIESEKIKKRILREYNPHSSFHDYKKKFVLLCFYE